MRLSDDTIAIIRENSRDDESFDVLLSVFQSLALKRARFAERVLELIPETVLVFDLDDERYIYANDGLQQMMGFTLDDVALESRIHPEDMERLRINQERLAAMPEGRIIERDYRVLHQDGSWRWLNMRDQVFNRRPDGSPQQIITFAQDFTERIDLEETMLTMMSRLYLLIDHIEAGVLLENPQRQVFVVNQTFCDVFGIHQPPATLIGMHGDEMLDGCRDIFAAPDLEVARINTLLANGQRAINERLTFADGRTIERDYLPVIVEEDTHAGHLWLYRDITQRIQAEDQSRQLERQRDQARVLAEFVGMTSHDLRTPLTVILSSAHLLTRANEPQRQQHHLRRIEEQASHLDQIIGQLHEMTALNTRQDITIVPQDLASMASRAINRVKRFAPDLTVTTELEIASVPGDFDLLVQALVHLLENAGQHATKAVIRARRVPGYDVVEVCDDGPGIPPEHRQRVLEPFYKVNVARTTDGSGAGLGLAMVKRIMDLHDGFVNLRDDGCIQLCFKTRTTDDER